MMHKRVLLFAMLLFAFPSLAWAAPRVVLLPVQAGPPFKKALFGLVGDPLSKTVTLLPGPEYRKAAKQMGVKQEKALAEPSTVAGVLKLLNAEWAVIARPNLGPGGVQSVYLAMYNAGHADAVFQNTFKTPDHRLDATTAQTMLAAINAQLSKTPAPAPVPETAPAAPEPAPPPPAAAPPPPPPAEAPPPPVADANAPAPAQDSNAVAAVAPEPAHETHHEEHHEEHPVEEPHHPVLTVRVGAAAAQRNATFSTPATGVALPCYCSPRGTPIVPGASANVVVLPFARTESWADGLGVAGEILYMQANTRAAADRTILSEVINTQAWLVYRFGTVNTAYPIVQVGAGYAYYTFPLLGSTFPGISYQGFNASLLLDVPMWWTPLGILLAGSITPQMRSTVQLAAKQSAWAWRAEVGLRWQIDAWADVSVLARYESFNLTSTGNSTLSALPSAAYNVGLHDVLVSGMVRLGLGF